MSQPPAQSLVSGEARSGHSGVACQTDDDIPYVPKYAGEDNVVIGSDFGHDDAASEIDALRKLKASGEVPSAAVDKILDANPSALYGLS